MTFNGVSNDVPKFQMRLKLNMQSKKIKKIKLCRTDFVVLLPHQQFTFAEPKSMLANFSHI